VDSKERILAALRGEEVDHVPFSPFLAYVWESFPQKIQEAGQLAFLKEVGADPLWRGGPCAVRAIEPPEVERTTVEEGDLEIHTTTTPVGSIHFTRKKSEAGNTSFLVEHPLKTEDDYKVRLWIEENTRFERIPDVGSRHFAGEGREGLTFGMLIPRCKSAYQDLVEFFVGTEELVYAQLDFPETVRALHEQMVENDLEAVRLALDAPYEYFITWEDSGTQNYSPTQYDEFIGSEIGEWCRLLEGAGKHYIQHACGHVDALVERMRDHGAAGVESISPPPTGNITIAEARRKVGDKFAIIGGIEPTQFLNLSEKELVPYVESVIEEGRGGPFVLANSDSCPPGVTVEKFKLVARTAKAHGS